MTHKRNARAPRPDPAAQDPMDYLLDDVMQATDKVAAELLDMSQLEADPLATLAGHCHTLAGRVAALVEVVRQMRDLQRGLVVISDPPMPAPQLITEDQALAARQRAQAQRTLVRWRMGADGLEPVYADQDLATDEQIRAANAARSLHVAHAVLDELAAGVMAGPTEAQLAARQAWLDAGTDGQRDGLEANLEDDLEASRPRRKMTRAEALAEAERLGGLGGAIFLMHWEKNGGQ